MKTFIIFCAVAISLATAIPLLSSSKYDAQQQLLAKLKNIHHTGITGGTNVTINQFKYMVSVHIDVFTVWVFGGSGVILNNRWILTTAVLAGIQTPDGVKVRVGSTYTDSQGSEYEVQKLFISPYFEEDNNYNIGLIKLKKPLKFSGVVNPIKFGTTLPRNKQDTIVTGFGGDAHSLVIHGRLKKAVVSFMDYKTCLPYYPSQLNSTSFCTVKAETGPCDQDWGSPLVFGGKLIGIFSTVDHCGETPAVYVDVTTAKNQKWIADTIKQNSD